MAAVGWGVMLFALGSSSSGRRKTYTAAADGRYLTAG